MKLHTTVDLSNETVKSLEAQGDLLQFLQGHMARKIAKNITNQLKVYRMNTHWMCFMKFEEDGEAE